MKRSYIASAILALLITSVSKAQDLTEVPRFSIFAGAGAGLLTAQETSAPFRINAGLEYFFKTEPHFSVGYMGSFVVANDQIAFSGGSQTPHRMVHYFPRVRCFLFSRDYALGGLSVNLAPGIAVQQLGGGTSGGQGAGSFSSIAAQGALEYNLKLEERVQLGLEASAEYLAPVRGTTSFPRTLLWTGNANLHFFLGGSK